MLLHVPCPEAGRLLPTTPSCPEGVLKEELKWKRGGSPRVQVFTAHSGLAQSLGEGEGRHLCEESGLGTDLG